MIPKENDRNDVYPDSRGILTVGIGHKVVPADKLKLGVGPDWYKEHKKTWSLMMDGDYKAAAREAQDSDWYDQTPERVRAFQRALLALRRK